MPAATASPRETAERFLNAAIGADPGDMADCYAPSVVIEMPFAVAPLIPARVETTREELRERFRAGTASRKYKSLGDVVIHETTDPGVVIIEPDFPELKDSWPFLWYENEYVVDAATTFILAANAAQAVTRPATGP